VPSDHASPALLLVHGAGAPAAWWQTLAAGLPDGVETVATHAPDATIAAATPAGTTRAALLAWASAHRPGRHVILLAAGTTLPPHWCERLLAALAAPNVIAAGPLDNTAAARNPLPGPTSADVDRIDALCWAYGRRALFAAADVSPLVSIWHGERLRDGDIATLAQGDALGALAPYRCVLLDHLYVAFPGRRATRDDAPDAALGELRAQLALALTDDACQPARAGLDPRPVVLHVLHGWGGGAERFVRDLAASDTARIHRVLIARGDFPRRRYGEVLELVDGSFAGPALRRVALPRPIADTALADADWRLFFDAAIAENAVDTVMVSSLIGHSLDALRSGLPTVVVAHDCYPLWPILHRDFGDTRLAFDDAQRQSDLAATDAEFEFASRDAAHWRGLRNAYVEAVLAARARLVAPSASALANVTRLAPELRSLDAQVVAHGIAAWPTHEANAPRTSRTRLRLVVPGRVRRGKGAELLAAALPALREHAEIFLLGAGAEAQMFFGERDVHVLLNYRRDELPALVDAIAPDAALILPTVAETFSYTLSEMRSLRVPVIATRVGALAERIADGVDGFLVEPDAAAIVARVAALAAARESLAAVKAHLATLPVRDLPAMAGDYAGLLAAHGHKGVPAAQPAAPELLELLARSGELSAARARIAALARTLREQTAELDARAEWASGLEREQRTTLRALQAQESENRDLRNDYEERGRWLKSLLQVEEDFAERTRWALALKSELDLAYGSFSWRITRPLRYAKRKLKALRARLGFWRSRIVSAWRRTRGSIARRGYAGTFRRALKEFSRPKIPVVAAAGLPVDDGEVFAVPTSATPHVSIVIPVYNKIVYTVACLRSLAEHAGAASFEVIVVDDCSTDTTPQRLEDVDGVRVIRNAQNLGFVGSCNAGAAAARGEFVLFLNNDTVVTPGWLDALVDVFAQEADAGLVGSKLVYPDGRLQESGGIVFRDGSGWNYGRFDDPADPRYNFRREADYCSGAAIILRRELFEHLGGFDQRYAPAYYEDTDLAFAVRKAGLKVYVEPRSTVIHFEGVTAGTDTAGTGMKRFQAINQEKFLDKWKEELARQPEPIDDAAKAPRAATFRAGKRVLIVDACTPTPDQDSGSLRMVNLMRLMRSLGWQVTFFAENRLYLDRYTPALQSAGVEMQYAPYLQDAVRLFRERGEEFDAIVLSRHYIAINYLGLARLYAPRATLIFDTVDLHYLRERRAAKLENSAELMRRAETTRAQELKLIRECDVTLVVSPVERELLARELPDARVEILSNVHEVYGCRRPFAERKDIVFVGSFMHPPNEDAVVWFGHEAFPAIRAALPGVRFHVIGQPPPEAVLALAADDFVVHGFVENLEPFMDGCRVSVAPLRYGAGVKGKVNMAMSYGLPVVATPAAVEGMHIAEGSDVLVAGDAAAFAAEVVRLYDDEALWNTLSANGLANVQRHFSFDAAQGALANIVR
jgi:GT2 family glycosyltransferase/glycosyltransferase involved in cell wall biosynthesis